MNDADFNRDIKYYQDWIVLFDLIKKHNINNYLYEKAIKGLLLDQKMSLVNFKKELINILNCSLNKNIKKFIKKVKELIEFNDSYGVIREVNKLKSIIKQLFFFEQLAFLEKEFVDELSGSLKENIKEFYTMFIDNIKSDDINNSQNFDLYYDLKKIKL